MKGYYMKNYIIILIIVLSSVFLISCDKNNQINNNINTTESDEPINLDEVNNIELSREEKIRSFRLIEEYFFQGRKIEEGISFDRPLDDNALLYIIQKKYTANEDWKDYLLPAEDEIKYKDIKDIVGEQLKFYSKITVEPEKIIVGYQNNRYKLKNNNIAEQEYSSYWYGFCFFSEGDNYGLWIDALTGNLLNMIRYPENWFDYINNTGEFQVNEKGNYTDEDIVYAAYNYLISLDLSLENVELSSSAAKDEILLHSLDYREIIKINNRRVSGYLMDGTTVTLRLLTDDLSIQEIHIY